MNSIAESIFVQKEIVIIASPEAIFAAFTRDFDLWWPKSHHLSSNPEAVAVLEEGVGGRWFERTPDGAEIPWGKVLVWERPTHLRMSWEIDPKWEANPNMKTEVDVLFQPEEGGTTRVILRHLNLETLGEHTEKVRVSLDSQNGWTGLLVDLKIFAEGTTGKS
jgi:uncharacterized protein YndB with AHSA1/START domain